ncbi:MAG: hypothetical protein ACRDGS_03775, partial [Chloroflexota bacterium]
VETGTRIADSGETLAWIREKALNLEGDVSLDALFRNAVGVSQGLMTADFLVSATPRKIIFDPLLRVEEYGDAVKFLLDPVNLLKDRLVAVDQQIAVLQSQTSGIPEKESQIAALAAECEQSEARVSSYEAQLKDLEQRLAGLDAAQEAVRNLEESLRLAESEAKGHEDAIGLRRQQLEAARAAQAIIEKSEAGYRAVLQARKELKSLEQVRQERDRVQQCLGGASAERLAVQVRIGVLEGDRDQARWAGTEAATMADAVACQTELDGQRQELQSKLHDGARVDGEISSKRGKLKKLDDDSRRLDRDLEQARVARQQAAALPAKQKQCDDVSGKLAELGPLKDERARVKLEGEQLREQRDRLMREVDRLSVVGRELEEQREIAARHDVLLGEQQAAVRSRDRARVGIEYQELAAQDLATSRCPLLQLTCPVVAGDAGSLHRLVERSAALQTETEVLEHTLSALEPEIANANAACDEVRRLEQEAAGLQRSQESLDGTDRQLEDRRKRYQELSMAASQESAWRQGFELLQRECEKLQSDSTIGSRVPLLEEQRKDHDLRAAEHREQLQTLLTRQEEIEACRNSIEKLNARLTELDDPRAKQQLLVARASRLPEIEARLEKEDVLLKSASERVDALDVEIAAFQTLDAQLDEQHDLEKENLDAYEAYLGSRQAALEVETRAAAVKKCEQAHAVAKERAAAFDADLAVARRAYNAMAHSEVRDQRNDTGNSIAAARQDLQHVTGRLSEVEEEHAALMRSAAELAGRQGDRQELLRTADALNFVRDTIKAAGPSVTEALLLNISEGASDIYAEIIGDHATELQWDRNYEVQVGRGSETRSFAQLSGGEQMSAALAVRLALLKEMSGVDFAFFDEPTQNLD